MLMQTMPTEKAPSSAPMPRIKGVIGRAVKTGQKNLKSFFSLVSQAAAEEVDRSADEY